MATSRSTRSTPRAQTCAYCLRRETIQSGVNQSSQFLLYSYSEYSSSRCSPMLQKKKNDPENRQINPVFNGFNASPPQFFQVVPYAIADISWTFHENLFIYLSIILNIANRHTTAPRWETVKQSSQAWNSLYIYFLCCARYIMKISWKSVHPFFHNSTNNYGFTK